MSENIDIYNQEQIVAAITAITAAVQANTITIEALKNHLGLSGTNTGDNPGVTAVTGTWPVVSSGGNTPVISMPAATSTTPGHATAAHIAAIAANTAKVSNATHTGDVTGATALTIANGAVTLAKMANVATGSVFYRKTAGTGAPEVQSLATLKADLGITVTPTFYAIDVMVDYSKAGTSGYLYVPLTSEVRVWVNEAGKENQIIPASTLGIPNSAKAVVLRIKYSGATLGNFCGVGPNSTQKYDVCSHYRASGETDESAGICRMSNGSIYYGTSLSSNLVSITVTGYFI